MLRITYTRLAVANSVLFTSLNLYNYKRSPAYKTKFENLIIPCSIVKGIGWGIFFPITYIAMIGGYLEGDNKPFDEFIIPYHKWTVK